MSSCYHVEGVECDNCRTGLNPGWRFDQESNRWVPPSLRPLPTSNVQHINPDIDRLEGIIDGLKTRLAYLETKLEAMDRYLETRLDIADKHIAARLEALDQWNEAVKRREARDRATANFEELTPEQLANNRLLNFGTVGGGS